MAKKSTATIKQLPSLHAVSRCIQYSEGRLYGVADDGSLRPIPLQDMSVRGTVSNYGAGYHKAKKQNTTSIDVPNPQTVEAAFLPGDCSRLRLEFSMNVLPMDANRHASNDIAHVNQILALLAAYKAKGGFAEIGRLVAWRLANASALWRNRFGVDKHVSVALYGEHEPRFTFAADALSVHSPEGFDGGELAALIGATLAGERALLMLDVAIEVTIGKGQEVFPSQEFLSAEGNARNAKSKALYSVTDRFGRQTAGMHPQKIGAAVRMFDIWHPTYSEIGPLAVEPFGYSHQHQQVFRTKENGQDLYGFLLNLDTLTRQVETAAYIPPEAHFVVSCMLRGGVFSGEGKGGKAKSDDTPPTAAEPITPELALAGEEEA